MTNNSNQEGTTNDEDAATVARGTETRLPWWYLYA